jgi:hypothetical protein
LAELCLLLAISALFWIGYSHGDESETDRPVALLTGTLVATIPLAIGSAVVGIWSLV